MHFTDSKILDSSLMPIVNGGINYDTVLSNTCASFQIQKMTGLHRKCAISSDSLDVCHATK